VWEVSRVFRITAFLALGVLLLVVSYLYSRFRPSIDKLLRGASRGDATVPGLPEADSARH
jgi:uncharacterized membrane protein